MTDSRILPGARGRLVDANGRPTAEFYDFFRRIVSKSSATDEEVTAILDQIREIAEKLGSQDGSVGNIPDGFLSEGANIFGQSSVLVSGTLKDGVVFIQLENDREAPLNTQYYGSDDNGVRGWHRIFNTLLAGSGIVKKMDGFIITGEVEFTDGLPSPGVSGDVYLVGNEIWSWDGASWVLEGTASGNTEFSVAESVYQVHLPVVTGEILGGQPVFVYLDDGSLVYVQVE